MPNLSIRRFCAAIITFSLLLTVGSAVFTTRRLDIGANVTLSAGSAADPLLSRAYLNDITKPYLLNYLTEKFGTVQDGGPYGQTIKDIGEGALDNITLDELANLTSGTLTKPYEGGILAPAGGNYQLIQMTDAHTLVVPSGGTVYVLSGRVMGVSLGASTVIDVVQGREFFGDWLYGTGRQVVVSEKGGMSFETLDDQAVLLASGGQVLPRQTYTAEFTDLAEALMIMGLFRGTDEGLKLERTALRGEALTLLIRILGKEAEALAAPSPSTAFSDVPTWLLPYASFGVKNGLTKGIGHGMFGNYLSITANEYMTFLLRALGYVDVGANADFHYQAALDFAVTKKIISANEANMLSSGSFTRDKLVYLSYYTLFAYTKDGIKTLLQSLIDSGAVSLSNAELAIASVTRVRN